MTKGKNTYRMTVVGCFIGYIVQAIVNNFLPLLFVMFHETYGIPLSKITFLVTFNFGLQLLVDVIAAKYVDKIGYRASMVLAHIFGAAGFVLLTILPDVCANPFHGLLISVVVYAVGGGLLEVCISPIVEACPTDNKEAAMSMLHSFYCWGHVGVVLLSTLYFYVFGIENWKLLALLFALVPVFNLFLFMKVPIASLIAEDEEALLPKTLFKKKLFWGMMILMLCAGACEQAVSQWASTFAEAALGVDKTVGDLAGPMLFAILMGASRVFYGKFGEKIDLEKFMFMSGLLCLFSYLVISLSPWPVLGLIGCGLCGLSVGIMWPGTFSIGAAGIRNGGTLMFALFAVAGDLGCGGGPTFVGIVSSFFGDDLKKGILSASIFPITLLIMLLIKRQWMKKRRIQDV